MASKISSHFQTNLEDRSTTRSRNHIEQNNFIDMKFVRLLMIVTQQKAVAYHELAKMARQTQDKRNIKNQ